MTMFVKIASGNKISEIFCQNRHRRMNVNCWGKVRISKKKPIVIHHFTDVNSLIYDVNDVW